MLSLLAEQYGKQLSPQLIRLYFDGLAHLPIHTVRAALNAHARNTEIGQYVPKIADVIRACEGGADDHAMRALQDIERAFSQVGAWESVAFTDTCITAVINDMGGWPAICARDRNEWDRFGSREFMRRYRSYRERGDANAPAYLPGYFERVNAASGYRVEPPRIIGRRAQRVIAQHSAALPGEDDE